MSNFRWELSRASFLHAFWVGSWQIGVTLDVGDNCRPLRETLWCIWSTCHENKSVPTRTLNASTTVFLDELGATKKSRWPFNGQSEFYSKSTDTFKRATKSSNGCTLLIFPDTRSNVDLSYRYWSLSSCLYTRWLFLFGSPFTATVLHQLHDSSYIKYTGSAWLVTKRGSIYLFIYFIKVNIYNVGKNMSKLDNKKQEKIVFTITTLVLLDLRFQFPMTFNVFFLLL